MKLTRKINLKRLAPTLGVAGLVVFSLFTMFDQPGTRRGGSGTLLATPAQAQETGHPTAATTAPQDTAPVNTASITVFQPDPLATLADSLKKKEKELEEREKALKKKEEYLESVRKETAGNLARIQALYEKLEKQAAADALAAQQRQKDQQKREKELTKWRSIYQAMPPEKAGPIIQGLETEFALELLSQMEPKKAAKILSCVQPEKAVELAKKLATKKP